MRRPSCATPGCSIRGGRADRNDRAGDASVRADRGGWAAAGVRPGDAIGVLCRNHRGVVDAMIACGKYEVRLVLLNNGFSKVQFTDVAVREGVSLGVSDEEFGQRLKLFVVLDTGVSLDGETIRNHVKENLAGFKVPRKSSSWTNSPAPRPARSTAPNLNSKDPA